MSLDLFGFIASAFVFFGTYRVAKHKRDGWIYRILGNILWVVFGYLSGYLSIILTESAFLVVDFMGFKNGFNKKTD